MLMLIMHCSHMKEYSYSYKIHFEVKGKKVNDMYNLLLDCLEKEKDKTKKKSKG